MGNMRSRVAPRRLPTTQMQLEIAESIIEAAGTVLAQDGYAGFTTNIVAERAGVSVGSLYRYFPNKEALLAELARRLERKTELLVLSVIEQKANASLDELIAAVVDALFDELGDAKLRQALRSEVPAAWLAPVSEHVDRTVLERIAQLLESRDDVRAGPYPLMAWIAGHAVELLVEAAMLDASASGRSRELREELIVLVVRYLRR